MSVRVRFAPSPTGYLHVGGARTALFNWLFARRHKGTFILRIEDTDEVRSTHDSVDAILESLTWLGLDWDEGPLLSSNQQWQSKGKHSPYFQMQRQDLYKKYLEQLETEGKVYRCYCTPEELDAMRRQATLEKRAPKYDNRCRDLTDDQRKEKEARGLKHVLRFKMPQEGTTVVQDEIRGEVSFENNLQQDLVIQKTSGIPTYNFACVVDDHVMEISHVIRGEEHLSNTPSQIQMYRALGWQPPIFAHLSMLLGPDGSKLSKRHGATSVLEYGEQGYLPGALRNYLALLGWATETSQDLFTTEDMIAKFDLARCQKSPAVFDGGKLVWLNGIYTRKLSRPELLAAVRPYLPSNHYSDAQLEEIVVLEQEKYKTLKDAGELLDFFFKEDYVYQWPELDALKAKSPNIKENKNLETLLGTLTERIKALEDFSVASIEILLKGLAKELGWKNPEVFHPLRFAISGRLQGPSLFHAAAVLGKDRVLARLARFHHDLAHSTK